MSTLLRTWWEDYTLYQCANRLIDIPNNSEPRQNFGKTTTFQNLNMSSVKLSKRVDCFQSTSKVFASLYCSGACRGGAITSPAWTTGRVISISRKEKGRLKQMRILSNEHFLPLGLGLRWWKARWRKTVDYEIWKPEMEQQQLSFERVHRKKISVNTFTNVGGEKNKTILLVTTAVYVMPIFLCWITSRQF